MGRGPYAPGRPGGLSPLGRSPRHSRSVYRRRRLVAGALAVAVVIIVAVLASGGGHGNRNGSHQAAANRSARGRSSTHSPSTAGAGTATASGAIPDLASRLLPWKLPVSLSRMVVLPGSGGQLVVAGGLLADQSSSTSVYQVTTGSGTVSPAGSLAVATHDAAGAVIAGRDFLFGGGSPTTFATDQSFVPGGSGVIAGQLPAPRSDQSSVTVSGTTYIIGGYDGSAPAAAVLATTDGQTFRTVASLPVPVRYAAVAALSGKILVFGGETVGSAPAPTDVIQQIDPATGAAKVVGRLPAPLEGAAAFVLGGHVYVAGGDGPSDTGAPAVPSTAQLDAWGMTRVSGSGGPTPTNQILAYDPVTATAAPAGHLQVPVTHAGVAVSGGRAWVMGGEFTDYIVSAVQALSPDPSLGTAGTAAG